MVGCTILCGVCWIALCRSICLDNRSIFPTNIVVERRPLANKKCPLSSPAPACPPACLPALPLSPSLSHHPTERAGGVGRTLGGRARVGGKSIDLGRRGITEGGREGGEGGEGRGSREGRNGRASESRGRWMEWTDRHATETSFGTVTRATPQPNGR